VSRIGKKPIAVPAGVAVSIADQVVTIKGPKGELKLPVVPEVEVKLEGGALVFHRSSESGVVRAKHGLMRALARNMVEGVSTGFTRKLVIQGIGYRAEVKGKNLVLNLGYSHPIEFSIPSDVQISVDKDGKISISGADRARVGQIAAIIREYRSPDRYKGKGIRYEGEHIALKEGKSA
jgi:large subunit ribosomal protein L6